MGTASEQVPRLKICLKVNVRGITTNHLDHVNRKLDQGKKFRLSRPQEFQDWNSKFRRHLRAGCKELRSHTSSTIATCQRNKLATVTTVEIQRKFYPFRSGCRRCLSARTQSRLRRERKSRRENHAARLAE